MKKKDSPYGSGNRWMSLGAFATMLTMLPCLLLGEDAIFTYTDQLDGEMIAYILQAKHLFQGNSLDEFLNGASKTALTVPAPLAVLLFLPGHYCGALISMALTGKLCGYAGMYLLATEMTGKKWIGALFGFLYSCIPFLAVYGLTQYGLPMLFWYALQLTRKKHLYGAYFYIILYGLCSSLVLAGFAVLGIGLAWMLWLIAASFKANAADMRNIVHAGTAWLLLLTIYILENGRLLTQLLSLSGETMSHKSAYILEARPFIEVFRESLLVGNQHCKGYHIVLLAGTLATAAMGICWLCWHRADNAKNGHAAFRHGRKPTPGSPDTPSCRKTPPFNSTSPQHKKTSSDIELQLELNRLLKVIFACFGWNLFFAAAAGLWRSAAGVRLRSRLTVLGAFQLDRMLWLAPCLWYLAAACGLAMACRIYKRNPRHMVCLLLMAAASGMTAFWALYSGECKMNLQKLRNPDYEMLSYRDYYAIGVMEQVRDFLDGYSPKNTSEYRVASLGIDPAAALYHGFYCLDGYSNNYSLDYKKQFRQIIAPELARSAYLKHYYDNWGNRCYLFSSECPGYYTIEKHGFYFQDYQINAQALYEMGGRYLLSAAFIQNAESQGLVLLNEAAFETAGSYYWVFVYEVKPQCQTQAIKEHEQALASP